MLNTIAYNLNLFIHLKKGQSYNSNSVNGSYMGGYTANTMLTIYTNIISDFV